MERNFDVRGFQSGKEDNLCGKIILKISLPTEWLPKFVSLLEGHETCFPQKTEMLFPKLPFQMCE